VCAAGAAKAQSGKPQNALQVREKHLGLPYNRGGLCKRLAQINAPTFGSCYSDE